MSKTIEQMMLEVLDAPERLRIVIMTSLPALTDGKDDIEALGNGEMLSCIYYMIDRDEDGGMWVVSHSCGGGVSCPSNNILIQLVEQILQGSPSADIYVESL